MLATTTSNRSAAKVVRARRTAPRRRWRDALATLAHERLRVDVHADDAAGAKPRGGDGEDAGSAAVVEHRLAAGAEFALSQRRQSRVVGCEPVPKARPGSRRRLRASGSGGSDHDGTMQKCGAISIGPNCACVLRTQSWSATAKVSYAGIGSPSVGARPATSVRAIGAVGQQRDHARACPTLRASARRARRTAAFRGPCRRTDRIRRPRARRRRAARPTRRQRFARRERRRSVKRRRSTPLAYHCLRFAIRSSR